MGSSYIWVNTVFLTFMGRLNSEKDLFHHRSLITHTRFRTKNFCEKNHDTLRHMKNTSTKHIFKRVMDPVWGQGKLQKV